MGRGKKAGKRGRRRGRAGGQASSSTPRAPTVAGASAVCPAAEGSKNVSQGREGASCVKCGRCSELIQGSNGVLCQTCNKLFHLSPQCLGLSQGRIDENLNRSSFACQSCRILAAASLPPPTPAPRATASISACQPSPVPTTRDSASASRSSPATPAAAASTSVSQPTPAPRSPASISACQPSPVPTKRASASACRSSPAIPAAATSALVSQPSPATHSTPATAAVSLPTPSTRARAAAAATSSGHPSPVTPASRQPLTTPARASVSSFQPSPAPTPALATPAGASALSPATEPRSVKTRQADSSSASAVKCGKCSVPVDGGGIVCSTCNGLFHLNKACVVLPDSGDTFVCHYCKLKHVLSASSNIPNSKEVEKNIMSMTSSDFALLSLEEKTTLLAAEVNMLLSSSQILPQTNPNSHQPSVSSSSTPQSNASQRPATSAKEAQKTRNGEQQRCRTIVVRCTPQSSRRDVQKTFKEVSRYLINKEVTIHNLLRLNSEKGLYRGTILDEGDRKQILRAAPKLKQSQAYNSIFIHRTLSHKQQQEKELWRKL